MKFEQALRAMRRGEVVRRRTTESVPEGWWSLRLKDGVIEEQKLSGGVVWAKKVSWETFESQYADDWVIVRKKKKAPKALRNVFTDPRVGDVISCGAKPETIRYVDTDMVATWDGEAAWSWCRDDLTDGCWTVVSRAEEGGAK